MIFVVFCMVFQPYAASRASEKIIYNHSINGLSYIALSEYIEQHLSATIDNFDIARTDFNGDNMDELIIKSKVCDTNTAFCMHYLFAETGDKILNLSAIQAREILISDKSTNGIRDILAFDNPHNDFDYSIYHWDAGQSTYILFREDSEKNL